MTTDRWVYTVRTLCILYGTLAQYISDQTLISTAVVFVTS